MLSSSVLPTRAIAGETPRERPPRSGELLEPWDLCFEEGHCAGIHRSLFAGVRLWDAHAHLGRDRDGHALDADALLGEMDRFGVQRTVVFPLDEPGLRGDFRAANGAVLDSAVRHSGRLIPFFRLDPWTNWEAEYELWLAAGLRGIKLHPRAQFFRIDDPIAAPIFARAEADGLPVLVHTGWGRDRPADSAAAVATRHPSLRLVLGHACFAELGRAIQLLQPCENVFFETSVVPVYDLVRLLAELGPERLLFGSDVPYRTLAGSLQALVGATIAAGQPREVVRPVLGDNLARLLGER